MKTLNVLATITLLGSLTLGFAETVDEQITAIQTATTQQERVKLMNQFKTKVSTMTQEERQEAVSKLRASMQESGDELKTQTRERTRTRVQDGEQTGEMMMHQKMNQNQQSSKSMHQYKVNPGTGTGGGMGMGKQ